jgi:hypothetical protein
MLCRKAWKAASLGWMGSPEAVVVGREGMGGIAVSAGEESEPWTENQERCLRLLLVLLLLAWSEVARSLVDLRPVISLERLWRLRELRVLVGVAALYTSSEVTAVPGRTTPTPPTPMWRPVSFERDFWRWMFAGMTGTAGTSSSSESPAPLARKLKRSEFLLELWLETVLRRLSRRLERFALRSVEPSSLVGRRR